MSKEKSSPKQVLEIARKSPELTIKELALMTGRNRAGLYRIPGLMELRAKQKKKREEAIVPLGFKYGDPTDRRLPHLYEAIDHREMEPIDYLIQKEEHDLGLNLDW
jgi:hypothetical protein